MIQVEHISKSYQSVKAVQDVSFEVQAGELFGLIGSDGAGKTTLFKILVTLLLADEGRATVADMDVVKDFRRLRTQIGYMPGKFSLYPDLSVYENLQFFATIFGTSIQANYDLIRDIYVQLERFAGRKASALSGGMKQKLALCCALIHRPKVLFLDEPTTGVDAVSRKEFWEMLGRLKAHGLTMLVSTPYMDEALRCDRIALIQHGQLLAIHTPQGIEGLFEHPLFAVRTERKFEAIGSLRAAPFAHTCHAFGEELHLAVRPGTTDEMIVGYLVAAGHARPEVWQIPAGIEDTFMHLMSHV